MRRIIITIGLVVLGMAPFAKAEIDSNYIDQSGVRYYIQTDKSVYGLGENVNISYKATNLTNENITLGGESGDPLAQYYFWVTQGDNQIWRYPYMSGAMVVEDYILHPSETREFQTTWNLMNDNGTMWWTGDDFLVNSGNYDVFGEVYLFPASGRVPVSVSIDVIPEPSTLLLFGIALVGMLSRRIANLKK